jgi:MFS family permease
MLSFRKRCEKDGNQKTTHHFLLRFLAIIGIGAVFTAGAAFASPKEAAGAWGVLQAIGAAGLITLIFAHTGDIFRLISGLALLLAYQLLLDNFWLGQVLQSVQGGLLAAPAWGALLLISTALAGLFHSKKKAACVVLSFALLAAGILSSFIFSLSKHRISLPYILISVGTAALVFCIIDFLLRISRAKLSLIQWWGKNPLMLYILHMILLGVTFLPGNETWYADAPLWLALLQLAAFFAVLCGFAWLFHRNNLILKL